MKSVLKDQVKALAKGGALPILQALVEELEREEVGNVRFDGSSEKLIYDTGKAEGRREGYQFYLDRFTQYANE